MAKLSQLLERYPDSLLLSSFLHCIMGAVCTSGVGGGLDKWSGERGRSLVILSAKELCFDDEVGSLRCEGLSKSACGRVSSCVAEDSHIQRNTSFYTAAIKQEWRHTRTGETYRAELDKPELKKPRGVSPLIFN